MKDNQAREESVALRDFLRSIPPGDLKSNNAHADVEPLLSRAWPSLRKLTDDANLTPDKLLGRTENLLWNPPSLTFDIERHGAMVYGSIKAHVYSWTVDVDEGTAAMGEPAIRRVGIRDSPLNVQAIAEKIAGLILAQKSDPKLKWEGNLSVRLLIADIFPARKQQTTLDRRRRFRASLETLISPYGWKRSGPNSYCRDIT